nr:uncharacterized protein LOC112097934 [Ipomoea trifida]
MVVRTEIAATEPSTPRLHTMKLDVPKFSGEDPHQWIFNIQEYFDFHKVPEDQRLQIDGFSLEREASEWYRWTRRNNLIYGWHDFLEKIQHRFGTHHFEDYQANLAKLTQKGSIADFQTEFEKLMNKVTGIQEPLLIFFFVGGLKPNLRREMLIAKPQSLLEAFKLAKAFEVRHEEIVRYSRATNRGLLPTPPPSSKGAATSTVPIRRMSAAEVQARRENDLCFYCDQKYSPSHRCRRSLHLLIAADDGGEDGIDPGEPDTALEESHADEEITGDISALNTLAGQGNPRSLRLWGDISKQKCLVLIDSGSTHNFIKSSTIEMLQLPIQLVKPFQVYIGSGDTLLCSYYSPNVTIVLQGTTFQIDLHVLPIAGLDVVLEIIWLQSLGTVAHA